MGWLADWDDVVHGTAVFGGALPLGLVVLFGWRLSGRLWLAVAGALIVSIGWIFGWPSWPLRGSDDAVAAGLLMAIGLVTMESVWRPSSVSGAVFRSTAWVGVCWVLCWILYPSWLAAEGRVSKRIILVSTMAFSIAVWAALMEYLSRGRKGENESVPFVTPAAWFPPVLALAALLLFGGSTRFFQSASALAATIGGVCVLTMRGRGHTVLGPVAELWGILSALLAWSGWLFAEIHVGLTLALLLCPFAALAARRIPLPRGNRFLEQLWDGLAAAVVAGTVIVVSWIEFRKGGDSLGY
jgi:hypothetical protein